MRRIIAQAFQFNKVKYCYTLDTDGLKLFLKCYCGNSEKAKELNLVENSDVKYKIYELISKKEGSSLAHNAVYKADTIRADIREMYNIDYPAPALSLLEDSLSKLKVEGILVLTMDYLGFEDYLKYKKINYCKIEYKNQVYYFSSEEKIQEFIIELKGEIGRMNREVNRLEGLILYLTDYFE
ncbi:hypothetical protein [Paenibacillus dendritiformis]|uniref:hypothetical protein n=1 Tax=Paenibacillus dendritiformis TaxID=130049 RepID=UPI00387E11A1